MPPITITFGELVTIGTVIAHGVALYVGFDRRITRVETKLENLEKECPIFKQAHGD